MYQKRTLQALRRGQGWLVVHPAVVAPGTPAARQAAVLDEVITLFTSAAAEQEAQERAVDGAARDIDQARVELVVHHMRHLAVVAESVIPDAVRMTVALRRPTRMDNEGLLAEAAAMAAAASEPAYRTALIDSGLPSGFVEQLLEAAAAFKRAIDSRGAAIGLRLKAKEAVQDAVRRGIGILNTLTVLVARHYRGDSATLAEWKQVRRVTIVGVRPPAAQPQVEPVPAPAQTGTSIVDTRISSVKTDALPEQERAA